MDMVPEEASHRDAYHGNDLTAGEFLVEQREEQVIGDGIGRQVGNAAQNSDRMQPTLRQAIPRDAEPQSRAGDTKRNNAANRPHGITNGGEVKLGRIVSTAEMIEEFWRLSQLLSIRNAGDQPRPGQSNVR